MLKKIKKCPAAVQFGLGNIFVKWGAIVTRCSILVFMVSLLCFVYVASGMRYAKVYDSFNDAPYAPAVSI